MVRIDGLRLPYYEVNLVEGFGMASRVGHRARVFACAALVRTPPCQSVSCV